MSLQDRIVKYLSGRKTPATATQIAKAVKAHPQSVRRVLAMGVCVRGSYYGTGLFVSTYHGKDWTLRWMMASMFWPVLDNQE